MKYTDPTGTDDANAIQDAAGNDTTTFTTGQDSVPDVTNNSTADIIPPALSSAGITPDGVLLSLIFDQNIDRSNLPPLSAFTVTADGSPVAVDSVFTTSSTTLLFVGDLTPVVLQGQDVVVTYTDPTAGTDDANAIQDTNGNDTPTFTTGQGGVPAVINNSEVTADTTAPTLDSAELATTGGFAGRQVLLTYSEDLDTASVPDTSAFTVMVGGESRTATLVAIPVVRARGRAVHADRASWRDGDGLLHAARHQPAARTRRKTRSRPSPPGSQASPPWPTTLRRPPQTRRNTLWRRPATRR